MSKILVLSDNEFLNLLYVMNLEVYLNTKVTLVQSVATAIEVLEREKFDITLTIDIINKEEAGNVLQQFLKTHSKKISLIISGTSRNEVISENVLGIAGKFNIQSILKSCAQILGITAKQMAELNVGAFYPISVESLLGLAKAPCHIYQDTTSQKFLVKQDALMGNIVAELKSAAVREVYVSSGDRLLITNKISLTLIEKITDSLKNLNDAPVETKVQALSDGYEFAAANLFANEEIKQQMQEIATASAKVMEDVAKDSGNLRSLFATMLRNKDGYIFMHSMIVSYVTYHMIKNVTWGGEGQVEKINFVLFFHDIFLAPIYLKYPDLRSESLLLENNLLSDKEREIVLNHALLASEMVAGYKRCPMGADVLIKQHHGMKKGKGFCKIYTEDLSPISKIILIAEMYVEEFMKFKEDETVPFAPRLVIPRLMSEFKTSSYVKIVQSLVNVPL
jgi:HD-GYP domain-containing protein (c-di-GMP phosphodiesterase class II)